MRVRTSLRATGGSASAAMRKAGASAVVEVAEDALTESNDRAPLEDGDLVRSGEVTAFPADGKAAITYDTPYAVKQHEDPTLNHPRQGEPFWLERTLEENAPRYFAYIADKVRAAMR